MSTRDTKPITINDGPPARYQLQMKRVNLDKESDEESKLRKFTLGTRGPRYVNRTILLVGETGSGKSTLVNALVNFVMGVKFKDKVWFEVISDEKDRPQFESQTSAVSVYEIFGFEGKTVPYSLTIIDTPGYGDTEGLDKDEMIIQLLQSLFCIPQGVDTVSAVGLVMKASVNRLDDRVAYVFNSVTSLFGKDMKKNIVVMMTHSDGREPTNALKALEAADIKVAKNSKNEPVYFLFNNCQKEKIGNEKQAAKFAFDTSDDGMKKITDFLGKAKPQSLKTTMEVMKERIRLTACVQNLNERVTEVEMKQEVIRKNREELARCEEEMEKNKDFVINTEESYKEKEEIKAKWLGDKRAVTCNNCKENCHYPGCTWAWSPSWCYVMKDEKCTSCSGKCPVDAHVKENWIYVTKKKRVEKTIGEMEAKYKENKTKSEEKTSLLEDLEKELSDLEQYKKQCLDEAFIIIEELEKISLNVNSVSTFLHLEFLIEKMGTGDTEKIQKLEELRSRMNKANQAAASYIQKLEKSPVM
uniref:AIG1-type G domain-containing protein n=1 Tax=Periophthalmus magnuspinnatus TaxID=409849 RepID=A0A3B4BAI7_9GOBI